MKSEDKVIASCKDASKIRDYVSKLTDQDISSHLHAYVLCAPMYGLPTYLIALLNEASQRIKPQTEEQP